MLSVIVYGRNDSHGYNLHKRVAISINAFAEVMTDPADEILFVDYNTPEDLPTFPEAIQDTLTDRAKAMLRILRVRPELHEPLRSKTHLVALESQSRNIAIRRSNPANRWLLFTNTDMLFVPTEPGQSLSSIVAGLPDAYYCLPRFELPELLWEGGFDRRDPAGNIAKLRGWARDYHLNEAVRQPDPMHWDAPGDFQLVLREDAFAIHGFDETMILGWHCDSNLGARLKLLRGSIQTFADRLHCYHCDHTRVAAANNKGNRGTVMNDHNKYIWRVKSATLPAQAKDWGWPDKPVEEVSLAGDTPHARYVSGLSAAISPATADSYENDADVPNWGDLTYSIDHVLPFACDQLVTLPRETQLLVSGCRPEFLQRLATVWEAMGFTGKLLVPSENAWLAVEHAAIERGRFRTLLKRAHTLMFEFGFASQAYADGSRKGAKPSRDDRRRLYRVEMHMRQAIGEEERTRPAGRRQPRRLIGINIVHARRYTHIFDENLSTTITPFCAHVRGGYVRSDMAKKMRRMMPLHRLRGRVIG